MIFITLVRFKRKPTKTDQAESEKMFAQQEKMGIRTLGLYWTFGRFDAVRIVEAPDERTALKALLKTPDFVSTETLLALKREDAAKLLE
jgi:uncharacterized protein with GYD domain